MADFLFWTRLANVASFCTLFGMSIWVGIISGPIMFKTLARHQFSLIQSRLFPLFFWLCMLLTSVCLGTFLLENPFSSWNGIKFYQGWSLIVALLLFAVNGLYLVPTTNSITFVTRKLEREVGAGTKPGTLEKDKEEQLLAKNPDYAAMKRRFGALHGISMLVTFAAILTLLVPLVCLAGNLASL